MKVRLRRPTRIRPIRTDPVYAGFWRIIDGAVRDALSMHPEYIRPGQSERVVRRSIVKRVTGALMGFAGRSRRQGADPG